MPVREKRDKSQYDYEGKEYQKDRMKGDEQQSLIPLNVFTAGVTVVVHQMRLPIHHKDPPNIIRIVTHEI